MSASRFTSPLPGTPLTVKYSEKMNELSLTTTMDLAQELNLSETWKFVAVRFGDVFDLKDMENMERHESPAVEMIKRLRQHALPIARLYKTMRSLNLLAPCEILAREIQPEKLDKLNQEDAFQNLSTNNSLRPSSARLQSDPSVGLNSTTAILKDMSISESPLKPLSSTSGTTNENSFMSSHSSSNHTPAQVLHQGYQFAQAKISHQQLVQQAPISAQPTTTPTLTHNGSSAFFTDSDVNYVQKLIQNNIKAYEVILPIVNADNGDIVYESEHNVYANGSFNNFNAMFSNTAIVYVKSRKLRCLKVTFDDQQGYTKELQMIKFKHGNLFTTDLICQFFQQQNQILKYSLLFIIDDYNTTLQSYIEKKGQNQNLFTFDQLLHQLFILKEVASTLSFLHYKDPARGKNSVSYGNLNLENVLIKQDQDKKEINGIKLRDFRYSSSIENPMDEIKLYEDICQYGMLVLHVIKWKFYPRRHFEELHNGEMKESDEKKKSLYRCIVYKELFPLIAEEKIKEIYSKLFRYSCDFTKITINQKPAKSLTEISESLEKDYGEVNQQIVYRKTQIQQHQQRQSDWTLNQSGFE